MPRVGTTIISQSYEGFKGPAFLHFNMARFPLSGNKPPMAPKLQISCQIYRQTVSNLQLLIPGQTRRLWTPPLHFIILVSLHRCLQSRTCETRIGLPLTRRILQGLDTDTAASAKLKYISRVFIVRRDRAPKATMSLSQPSSAVIRPRW